MKGEIYYWLGYKGFGKKIAICLIIAMLSFSAGVMLRKCRCEPLNCRFCDTSVRRLVENSAELQKDRIYYEVNQSLSEIEKYFTVKMTAPGVSFFYDEREEAEVAEYNGFSETINFNLAKMHTDVDKKVRHETFHHFENLFCHSDNIMIKESMAMLWAELDCSRFKGQFCGLQNNDREEFFSCIRPHCNGENFQDNGLLDHLTGYDKCKNLRK